ncbi:FAD-dependent oxidoreductase [Mycobacterium sherrisii]|uniref:FAD-dependent oxidoreductase n=1 Tax=Mycobacterium sherrisii TaxID=243061 RepID=UPI0039765BCF
MTAEPSGWNNQIWDRIADVVVVGTGAAGGAAAAAASRAGASVLMLDKADYPGGTTAKSGGGMWIPNNFALRARGVTDERDRCVRYMVRSAYPAAYRPDHPTLGVSGVRLDLIETFFDHAGEVIDELIGDGVLTLEPYDFPDYYSDLPEAVGWSHALVPTLPKTWRRGDPGGGELLATRLRGATEERGNATLLGCEVVGLIRNHRGEVIGIEAHRRRSTLLIGARRGVVFGSGGFLHNPDMVNDYLRGPILGGAAAATATGDLVTLAGRVGAQLGNMNQAWWDQVVVEQAAHCRVTSRDVFYAYGDSMVMVNRFGHRALNEKSPYTDRGQAHFSWDTGRHEYGNRLMFMIFDEAVRTSDLRADPGIRGSKMGRYPVPFPEESPSYLISGGDFDELAQNIDTRLLALAPHIGSITLADDFVVQLRHTIARFNDGARLGQDHEFRRGRTMIERAWESTTRPDAVSDSLYPFADTGPYHCVILGAGALDTKGGPRTDCHGRILDGLGAPIAGLYGAGNCVASPSGQAYWGPGTTIGLAVTFGYLAGRHAASQPARDGSPGSAG